MKPFPLLAALLLVAAVGTGVGIVTGMWLSVRLVVWRSGARVPEGVAYWEPEDGVQPADPYVAALGRWLDPIETGTEACAGELAECRDQLVRLRVAARDLIWTNPADAR